MPLSLDGDHAADFPSGALAEWLRLPLRPILDPGILPPADQKTAGLLLGLIPLGQSFGFTYHGGSDPGTRRSVLPVLLFQKFDPELPVTEPRESPAYLLAFCQTRNAPRIFRLDRIQTVDESCEHAISSVANFPSPGKNP